MENSTKSIDKSILMQHNVHTVAVIVSSKFELRTIDLEALEPRVFLYESCFQERCPNYDPLRFFNIKKP